MKTGDVIQVLNQTFDAVEQLSRIYHWEHYGLFDDIVRSSTNRRDFNDACVKRAKDIWFLKTLGLKTSEVKRYFLGDDEMRDLAIEKLKTFETKVMPYGKRLFGMSNKNEVDEVDDEVRQLFRDAQDKRGNRSPMQGYDKGVTTRAQKPGNQIYPGDI